MEKINVPNAEEKINTNIKNESIAQENNISNETNYSTENEAENEIIASLYAKEKILRSKILNQPKQCKKKQPETEEQLYTEKIQMKSPLTETEQEISQILIQNADTFHTLLFFQPVIETTQLVIGSISSENIEDCESQEIEEVTNTTQQNEIIETKYKYLKKITLTQYLETQIHVPKQKNTFITQLITSHLQLLESIKILQAITPQIVHFNIHPETILYDEINANPVITDFRMAFTKETLDNPEESKGLFPITENEYWCPEIHELAKLLDENIEQPNLDKINVLKQTYTTWDVYSVNKLFYVFLINQIEKESLEQIPFMKSYMDLLDDYIEHTNSNGNKQRLSIEELLTSIETIFQSVSKTEYETLLSLFAK